MLLVIGELGFRLFLLLIFLVFPVFGLILRRKWRLEVVRRDEISRLLVLAAEESARAEFEASIGYGYCVEPPSVTAEKVVVVVPRQRVCAVCCEPTYNRCSRCKLINYCSGKCQIIHWRQGHKNECHPLPAGSEINDEASPFVGDVLHEPYFHQGEAALEEHEFSSLFSSDLSVEDDGSSLDSSLPGEDPGSDTVFRDNSASFGLSTSISGQNICVDVSSSDDDSLHDLNLESYDSSSTADSFETASSESHLEQIRSVEEKTHSHMSAKNDAGISVLSGMKNEAFSGKISSLSSGVSHSNKNYVEPSISTSGFWDGTLDTSRTRKMVPSIIVKSKPIGVGNGKLPDLKPNMPEKHLKVSETVTDKTGTARTAKLITGSISSNKEPVTRIRLQIPALSSFKEPDTRTKEADENRSSVGVLTGTLKDISLQSSSFTANHLDRKNQKTQKSPLKVEFSSSGSKGHTAPVSKSLEGNGNTSMTPPVARSIPSSSVGLKSSMLKVYEQFRAPRSSKQGDGVGINGEKALFAYDVFVKLYHWNKVELLPCGLVNCGNSCYANVVLQCLAFTPPVTAYLLQGLHSKICTKKEWCFTCEFERLILKANEVGYPQSPIGILSHIQKIGSHLTNGREEDAHEFLRYAVETMQSICLQEAGVKTPSSLEEETTLVGLTFGGYLRSKIKCTKCHVKSKKQERMMDLTVEIEGDVETLEDALQRFTGTESLDGENKYHCGRCNSYEKAKKKLNILEAPNVLTIALKRFQSGKFGKLNKSIRFPEILNLAPYMRGGSDKAPIYRLYGVVVHLDIMNASFSGHYVCYVRNAQNKWFKIDDSTVKPVELDQVLNKGAYMLFYSRCSPRAPRSIRSTIISRDLPIKIKNPSVNPWSNGKISASSQRDLSTHANHIPDDLGNLGYVHQYETRFSSQHNNNDFDSLSDKSSIFTDEVSTSTDSTRDSISADDISDYIFGYNAFSTSSDLDISSSSSSSSSSPLYTTHSPLANSERYASALPEHNVLITDNGKTRLETGRAMESSSEGGVTFLHSNSSSEQVRNLVNISSRETDSKKLRSTNPLDYNKSGVHLRQLSRKKAE